MKDPLFEGWLQRLRKPYEKQRVTLRYRTDGVNLDKYPESIKERNLITQVEESLTFALPPTEDWRELAQALYEQYPDFNTAELFSRKMYLQGYIKTHLSNYTDVLKKYGKKEDYQVVRQTLDFDVHNRANGWIRRLHRDRAIHFQHIKVNPKVVQKV